MASLICPRCGASALIFDDGPLCALCSYRPPSWEGTPTSRPEMLHPHHSGHNIALAAQANYEGTGRGAA